MKCGCRCACAYVCIPMLDVLNAYISLARCVPVSFCSCVCVCVCVRDVHTRQRMRQCAYACKGVPFQQLRRVLVACTSFTSVCVLQLSYFLSFVWVQDSGAVVPKLLCWDPSQLGGAAEDIVPAALGEFVHVRIPDDRCTVLLFLPPHT